MPRHELHLDQLTLRYAIDQSHAIVVPDWELNELAGESTEQLALGSSAETRRDADGWTQLPNFPPPPRPLADTEGTHEWELVSLNHEGADEQEED